VQPVFDVYASVQGTDLGSVSNEVNKIVAKYQGRIGKGSSMVVRGQVQSMNQAFLQLGLGICFAVLLVYFLHGGQLPVVARPAHHPDACGARSSGRSSPPDNHQCACAECRRSVRGSVEQSSASPFANEPSHRPEFGGHRRRAAALGRPAHGSARSS